MLAVPDAKVVRGYSFFGLSFVYIIFEDHTDMYWARSRVLESLNYVANRLPEGVTPTLGPDATGVGWLVQRRLRRRPVRRGDSGEFGRQQHRRDQPRWHYLDAADAACVG